ncbi:MAG: biopolymer transport protein ExbB [Bradymonadia bacterium]|jgi:biopolymer transport protein ExbB
MRVLLLVLCVAQPALAQPALAQPAVTQPAKPALAQPGQVDRLELAYKKEFAFLEAEKTALAERLKTVERDNKKAKRRAQGQLAVSQKTVLSLGMRADKMGETLRTLERDAEQAAEGQSNLEGLVQAVDRSLTPFAITLPEAGDEAAKIAAGFGHIDALLAERGGVRSAPGQFFLADGKAVDGTLVRLGDIAVFGVSATAAGALTPAGGGKFKLDLAKDGAPRGEETARALARGESPASMSLFLFESAEKNFEARPEKTALQIVQSGGAIAWVIVGIGAFALLLVTARFIALLIGAGGSGRGLIARVEGAVVAGDIRAALDTCRGARGGTARVLEGVVLGIEEGERSGVQRDVMESLVAERLVGEERRLDRFGAPILIIAAVAPLLGLLGTVTGMISTFDVITEFGTGNPKLLSGGISEALITTELGLIVAIPALMLGNLLSGWAGTLKSRLEERALHLMNVARVGRLDAPDESQAPVGPRRPASDVASSPGGAMVAS